MTNDSPVSQVPPRAGAVRGKGFRRVALVGMCLGGVVTATGLLVVIYCAYMTWKRIYAPQTADVTDAGEMTAYFESMHSVAMGAVKVTLGGVVVLAASLWALPGRAANCRGSESKKMMGN